ncbi:MAG: tetratricopeptide repeat protein [Bacteroidota bacterium]
MRKSLKFFLFLLILSPHLPAQNRHKVDSLLKLVATLPDDTNKANALYQLSRQYWNSNPDTVILYGNKLLVLARKLDYKKGLAGAFNTIGVAHSDMAEFDSAVAYYLQAEKHYRAFNNLQGAGMILNNIGVVYKKQGKLDEAISYYLQALKIAEETSDKKSQAMTLNNIAIIFRNKASTTANKDEFNMAVDYANRSLAIAREINNRSGMAAALNTLGTIAEKDKDFEKALSYHTEALEIYKQLGDKRSTSISMLNVGIMYYEMKKLDLAVECYLKALQMKTELQDKAGIIACYNNLGAVEAQRMNFKKAHEYFKNSEDLCKSIGSLLLLRETYQAIYESYEKAGDYRNAFIYHKLYSDVKDSLVNAESSKSIVQMQALYETEKKDKEILRQNAELKQKDLEALQKETQRNGFIIASVFMLAVAGAVFVGYRQKQKANVLLASQKSEIQRQKDIVEEQQKEILDSMRYASRIQQSLLPTERYIEQVLKRLKK